MKETLQEILEDLVYKITKQPLSFTPNYDKKIAQAKKKIEEMFGERNE